MSGKATTVLDIREILRRLRAGQNDSQIQRDLGLNRRTIQKYRRWAQTEGFLERPELADAEELNRRLRATLHQPPPETPSKAAPFRTQIIALREQGLEIQAVYQRLRALDPAFTGSYSALYRYVSGLEPKRPAATVRVETAPGEQAQVDFGAAGRMYDPASGQVRKAWMFVMTLSWSRHQYVDFVFDQSVPTWLRLHVEGLAFFGGVVKVIKLDNLKAAIVKACVEDPQVQQAYRDCGEHYGYLISPCRVATPEHKGKVESGVHYVARNFLAGRDFTRPDHHIGHARHEVQAWIHEVAGVRRHGTTHEQPLARFERERAALLPLPAEPFEPVVWKTCKLHRDCHVVFENGYYSAPHALIGATLSVAGTAKTVRIFHEHRPVAVHSRCPAGERRTLLDHLPPEKVAGLTLTPEICRDRAAGIGAATTEVVTRWLEERPIDRLGAAHRLLRHPARELEAACRRALDFGDPSPRTVFNILKNHPVQPKPEERATPLQARFARDITELVPVYRSC